jgi:hypothetical protein
MEALAQNPEVYGVSWFFMAMLVAGIAQGKNREGLNWFLASWLFTPPIALGMLLIFFDKLPEKTGN